MLRLVILLLIHAGEQKKTRKLYSIEGLWRVIHEAKIVTALWPEGLDRHDFDTLMIELFETDVLTMDGGALAFAKFGRGEKDLAESYVLKFIAEHAGGITFEAPWED